MRDRRKAQLKPQQNNVLSGKEAELIKRFNDNNREALVAKAEAEVQRFLASQDAGNDDEVAAAVKLQTCVKCQRNFIARRWQNFDYPEECGKCKTLGQNT